MLAGNKAAKAIWLKHFDPTFHPCPTGFQEDIMRLFLREKYILKKFHRDALKHEPLGFKAIMIEDDFGEFQSAPSLSSTLDLSNDFSAAPLSDTSLVFTRELQSTASHESSLDFMGNVDLKPEVPGRLDSPATLLTTSVPVDLMLLDRDLKPLPRPPRQNQVVYQDFSGKPETIAQDLIQFDELALPLIQHTQLQEQESLL